MHPSAMTNTQNFFATYGNYFKSKKNEKVKVVEIGSQNVNGSIRDCCPEEFDYIGLDFVQGKGVDIILDDPYCLPFVDQSVDIVVSNSCFEHSEMFWLIFLEAIRVLKDDGLCLIIAPANGVAHRYPVDCWRFYPDTGRALATWANRNGYKTMMLESYISLQDITPCIPDQWNDFVSVFLKNSDYKEKHIVRIIDKYKNFTNGLSNNTNEFIQPNFLSEDQRKLRVIQECILNKIDLSSRFDTTSALTEDQRKIEVISKILSNEIRCF